MPAARRPRPIRPSFQGTQSVTGVTPAQGPVAGNQSVTISGSNFSASGNGVTLGGTAATVFAESSTSITVRTPFHAAGAVNVVVTTAGSQTATATNGYTYVAAPAVTAVAPTVGGRAGGQSVVLTGTNFAGTSSVLFGSTPANSFTVNSNTQITAMAPAHAAGGVNITVTTAGGTSATGAANAYVFTAPITSSVVVGTSPIVAGASSQLTFTLTNPNSGAAVFGVGTSVALPANVVIAASPAATNGCGGTLTATAGSGTIMLSGGNVAAGGSCTFGASVTSATAGSYSIPTGAATSSSTDPGSAGTPGTLVVQVSTPSVSAVSPAQGTAAGGTTITITGMGFTGATGVTVGGAPATAVTVVSDTRITATTPAGTAGAAVVQVITPTGTSTTNGSFTYLTPPTADNQSVTVAYQTARSITLSGGNVTSYTVQSAPAHGSLSGTAPNLTYVPTAGYSGPDSFTFTTTNGSGAGAVTSAPATVSITVQGPIPAVSNVAPAQGATAGGTSITIAGSGFTGATAVTIGGNAATGVRVVNDNQITATTPPGTAGAAAVAVTNAVGTSTTNGTYTYVASPMANAQSVTTAFNTASAITLTGTNATSYTVQSAPAHGTLSGTAPNLTYTPTTGYNGADSFTFTASNGAGTSAPATVSISVGGPAITVGGTPGGGTRGQAYTASLTASGGTSPYTFAVTGGALPPGLSIASGGQTGTISGTPTASGSFSFTVTVTDSSSPAASTTANYTIAIAAPALAMTPAAGALPGATTGAAYSQTVTTSGGTAPYNYAVTSGALPAGLTLSAGGILSGTPTMGGNYSFTITSTDASTAGSGGPYAVSSSYTLSVQAATVTVSPPTLPGGTVGASYSQTTTASGGTAPYSYAITSGVLPAGLTLSSNGTVSGTPTAGGTFTFTVEAADSSTGTGAPYRGSRTYSLTIAAPTVTVAPATLPDANTNVAYSQVLTASGGTAPYTYAVVAGMLPAGLTLSSAGTLAGTATTAGNYTITVRATDSSTGSGPYAGTRTYTLAVTSPAIAVSPASLAGAAVGAAYSQMVTASGGNGGYTFAVTAGALPAGITLSTSGALSGTPTAGGSFTFTITAADGNGNTGARGYTLTVAAPTIAVAPATLPAGASGVAYNQTLTASGGTAPYSYAVTAGALPAGITLASNGTLSGTPTASGSFTFTATATDSSTGADPYGGSRSYTLSIDAPTIAVSPAALANATVGAAYSQAITASGGSGSYSFAVTAGALPAGLVLATNGTLSGTPTAGGSFTFTVTATDGTGNTGARGYTLTVAAPAIAVAPATLPAGSSGVAYSQTLTASGGTAPYSYAVTAGALPAGITLASNGTLSGTPTASGSFTFTATATDGSTGSGPYAGSRSYTLTIGAPTLALSPAALANATAGAAYGQAITASGGTAPYSYAVTAGALPAGITLSTSGTLAGTPTASGSFTFSVTATDATPTGSGGPYTVTRGYTLTVAAATLAISPATLPDGAYQVAYSQQLSTRGGIAPYSYAVTAGALPAGITLSSAGLVAGTPTAFGQFNVTITATDSATGAGPDKVAQAFTLTIQAPATPVAGNVTATIAYGSSNNVINPALSGGTTTSLAIATPPAHGTARVDGQTLVYTPATGYAGTDSFTYTASNAGGTSAPAMVSVTIAAPTVTITPTTLPDAKQGAGYSQQLTANGGAAPYAFALASGALPAGLTLSASGVVAGTPTAAGPATFTVKATDSSTGTGPFSATQAYTLQVAGSAPVAAALKAATTQGVAVSVDLTGPATGGPFTAATIVSTSPSSSITTQIVEGGSAAARTYRLTLTPALSFSGTAIVTYTLSNQYATSAPATVTVAVAARPDPTTDPTVNAISTAQADATRRFATAQVDNFFRRNEQLHHGGAGTGKAGMNLSLSGGSGTRTHAPGLPTPFDDFTMLKAEHARGVMGAEQTAGLLARPGMSGLSFGGIAGSRGREAAGAIGSDAASLPAAGRRTAAPVPGSPDAAVDGGSGERRIGSIGMWSGGAIAVGTRDPDTNRDKITLTSGGLSAGADIKLADTLIAGFGGGYGGDTSRIGGGKAVVKGDAWSLAAYGSWSPASGFFIDGVAGGGALSFTTSRVIALDGSTANGSRRGSMIFGSLATGIDRQDGWLTLSAYGRLDYLSAHLDRFTEGGASIYRLTYGRRGFDSISSVLGARVAIPLSGWTARLRGEWRHEFADQGTQLIDYADVTDLRYATRGDLLLRDAYTAELEAELVLGNGWRFSPSVAGTAGSGARSGTGRVTLRKEF